MWIWTHILPYHCALFFVYLSVIVADRRYSSWSSWTACPSVCHFECLGQCYQVREKTCLRPEDCHDKLLRRKTKTCGVCRLQDYKSANNQSSFNNHRTSASNGIQPRQQLPMPNDLPRVTLQNHCLGDEHYSRWNEWSQCLPVCKRVRFRHCLSMACMERVPYRDDPSVMQEEWCVPPSHSSYRRQSYSDNVTNSEISDDNGNDLNSEHTYLNCGSFLIRNNLQPDTELEIGRCEKLRLYGKRGRTKKRKRKKSDVIGGQSLPQGNVLNLNVSCGTRVTQRSLKIIGGKSARPGDWPWQVAIMINKGKKTFSDFPRHQVYSNLFNFNNYTEEPKYVQYCGGVLIAPMWVLTAAHCVKDRDTGLRKPNMAVMAGETDMRVMRDRSSTWHSSIYKITTVVAHSQFEWQSVDNDIALVKLDKPVLRSDSTGYCCVPGADMVAKRGTECVVVGWGKNHKLSKKRASKRLKEAVLPLVKRRTCRNSFNFTITRNQMCAGYNDGRSDSCDGDSGGPLMCLAQTQTGQRWIVYGITSFGPNDGCGIAGKYGVYTKVTNYSEWIKYVVVKGEDPLWKTKSRRRRRNRRHRKSKRRQKLLQRFIT